MTDMMWFLEHNLARQSRDHRQNNCHKFQKHVLYWRFKIRDTPSGD